ncbi:MAG: phosphoribosylamine--glycine ligase family protein, partial [Planctomycetota bacterium]|nr:phosphoribosylamine--glycine ligase family protein [Planctomycetota bacterium]
MSRKKPPACPSQCNVLLIGGGGREHALAWKLKQSPRIGKLWLTDPGNGGLARLGQPCPVKIDLPKAFDLVRFCN